MTKQIILPNIFMNRNEKFSSIVLFKDNISFRRANKAISVLSS